MKKPEDMTPQEIAQELSELEAQINTRQARHSHLRRRLALDACPYHVGEILVNRHGDRGRIDEIGASTSVLHGSYAMRGVYLRKDGTPAVNPGRDNYRPRFCGFMEWEDWKRP